MNREKKQKLSDVEIDTLCICFIRAADSDALWLSPLACRAALTRQSAGAQPHSVKRSLGLKDAHKWPPKDVAFFPLHDLGHWSLLVIYRSQGLNYIYHYDSVPHLHEQYAISFVGMLCEAGLLKSSEEIHVRRVSAFPLQKENWECGWFLVIAVQKILAAAQSGGLTPLVSETLKELTPL